MKEILEIYNLNGKLIKNQERNSYYSQIKKEFEKTGKILTKIKTIKLFLMNSKGRIYLQKRSNLKSENFNPIPLYTINKISKHHKIVLDHWSEKLDMAYISQAYFSKFDILEMKGKVDEYSFII